MFNLYWDLINCRVGSVLIFIALISLPQCESGILKVIEGEKAQLDFSYPCDSTVVTLQHANDHPFYRSANPQYMLLSSNQNLVNYTEAELDQCFLNLTVNPVTRDDQGTYILTIYKNGSMLPDFPRISLMVYYPPGKAWCEFISDYKDGEWILLRCTAPQGTLPGQIVCYLNDTRLPKWNEPKDIEGKLNQVILARLDSVLYCCSSTLTEMTDKCDCTDWMWDPMSDSVSDIADPCPQTMSTHLPPSTHNVTIDNVNASSSNLVTVPTKCPENHKNNCNLKVIYALITVISVLAIITLSIAFTCTFMYRRKTKELARLQSSIKPESEDPCLPV